MQSVSFNSAIRRCSVPASDIFNLSASSLAIEMTFCALGVKRPSSATNTPESVDMVSSIRSSIFCSSTPFARSTSDATPEFRMRATSKCSVPT